MKRKSYIISGIGAALSALMLLSLTPLFAAGQKTDGRGGPRKTTPTKEWFEEMRTGNAATPTCAEEPDGKPVESFWDIVGEEPVFPGWPLPLRGDLDGDGAITPADARLALRFSVGLEPQMKARHMLWAADLDEDGKAAPADARRILRKAVGLEQTYIPDPAWDVYRLRTCGLPIDYEELGALKALEVNAPLVTDIFGSHLPLWRIDSAETRELWLAAFRETDKDCFLSDDPAVAPRGDVEVPALLKRYGDAFFAENDLLICYKQEGSGGYTQAVYAPVVKDGTLTLTVSTTDVKDHAVTADIADWLLFIPVPKTMTATVSCNTFDCLRGETLTLETPAAMDYALFGSNENYYDNWMRSYDHILTGDAALTLEISENPQPLFSLLNCQDGGYLWECECASNGGLEIRERYVRYPEARGSAGAPSLQEYSVIAKKTGTYTLHFSLKRAWENESIAERTVTVTVGQG